MADLPLLALAVAAALVLGALATGFLRRVHPILILLGITAFVSEADLTQLIGPQLNDLIEISRLGLAALFAVPGALWLWFRGRDVLTPAFVCLLALPVAGLLTAPWSADPFQSIFGSGSVAILLVLAYYAVDRFGVDQVATAVLFGLLALLVCSIAWDVIGPGPPPNEVTGQVTRGYGDFVRWRGLTDQENQLGRTAALCVLLCLIYSRRWPMSWVLSGVVLGSVALVGSQSKTSMAALLITAGILAWRRDRLELVAAVAAAPAAILLTAVLVGINPLAVASDEVDSDELLTATGRTTAWVTTLDISMAKPIFGHGAFASLAVLEREMRLGRLGYDIVDPHNTALTLLLTQGLVGVFLMVGAVVLFIRSPKLRTPEARDIALLLVMLGIISLAENIMWKANTSIAVLALCFATVATRLEAKPEPVMAEVPGDP